MHRRAAPWAAKTPFEKVELRGFGSFRLRRRKPHRGRNPRTGDRVEVPSKRVAYFTPGKELKALINRDPEESVPPASSRVVCVDCCGGLEGNPYGGRLRA